MEAGVFGAWVIPAAFRSWSVTMGKSPARLTSYSDGLSIHGRPIPYGSCDLPADFARRLTDLKEASGLTWNGFAEAVGIESKNLHRWRRGTEPSGRAMHSLFCLASRIPGGLDILMGGGSQMSLWRR